MSSLSSNKNDKKISFNEVAQEDNDILESQMNVMNDHEEGDINTLELMPNTNANSFTFPDHNPNHNNMAMHTSSSRRGRTMNTLIAPLYKRFFLIAFVSVALLLIIIGIFASLPPSSNFKWPPPVVTISYDPSNPTELTSTLITDWKAISVSDFTFKYHPEWTYYQRSIMETDTSIHAEMLGTVESEVRFLIDSKMKVDEYKHDDDDENKVEFIKVEEDGMEQIEYTVTHVQLSQVTNGHTVLEVDSSTGEGVSQQDGLDFTKDLVGHTSTIIVDKKGKIVSSSNDHEGLTNAIDTNQVPSQLSASQQYRSIHRFTEALPQTYYNYYATSFSPSSKLKVGDEWIFEMNVEGNDSVEYYSNHVYSGTGTLLGFTEYDGVDVAVIHLSAEIRDSALSWDMDDLDYYDEFLDDYVDEGLDDTDDGLWRDRSLGDIGTYASDLTIKSGSMNSLLYWDYMHHYPRWYKGTNDMVISMPNTMSPTTGSMMDVPTKEEFEVYIKVKK